jgi:hypothetical protein
LRAGDFYGPGINTSAVGKRFFDQLKKGVVEVMGNKDKIHTFTFVPDYYPALYEKLGDCYIYKIKLPKLCFGNKLKSKCNLTWIIQFLCRSLWLNLQTL